MILYVYSNFLSFANDALQFLLVDLDRDVPPLTITIKAEHMVDGEWLSDSRLLFEIDGYRY